MVLASIVRPDIGCHDCFRRHDRHRSHLAGNSAIQSAGICGSGQRPACVDSHNSRSPWVRFTGSGLPRDQSGSASRRRRPRSGLGGLSGLGRDSAAEAPDTVDLSAINPIRPGRARSPTAVLRPSLWRVGCGEHRTSHGQAGFEQRPSGSSETRVSSLEQNARNCEMRSRRELGPGRKSPR